MRVCNLYNIKWWWLISTSVLIPSEIKIIFMSSLNISVILYSNIIKIPKILFYEAYFYNLNDFVVIIYVFT